MGVLLMHGSAFESCGNGFGGRQQGRIDDIGRGSRAAITGVDPLHCADRRGQADERQLRQPPGYVHLGFLKAHAITFQRAKDLFNAPS
jgi:hypothetical protein